MLGREQQGQLSSARAGEIFIGPWLEDLIWQYQSTPAPAISVRRVLVIAAIASSAALSPSLLRLDRAAYPSEPDKAQALEICGRTDPTFLRFLASERAACYERSLGVVSQAAAASPPRSNIPSTPADTRSDAR